MNESNTIDSVFAEILEIQRKVNQMPITYSSKIGHEITKLADIQKTIKFHYTADGVYLKVQDVDGIIYEIEIKPICNEKQTKLFEEEE